MVHVRFEGHSYDLDERRLALRRNPTDQEVKACLATYFDVPVDRFGFYVIDRPAGGTLIVRPEAVYG